MDLLSSSYNGQWPSNTWLWLSIVENAFTFLQFLIFWLIFWFYMLLMILHFKTNVSTKNIFTFWKFMLWILVQSTKIFNKHVKTFCRKYHFFKFVCLCAKSKYPRPPLAMCRVCVCLCRSAVYCLVSCLVSAGASYIIATTNTGAIRACQPITVSHSPHLQHAVHLCSILYSEASLAILIVVK